MRQSAEEYEAYTGIVPIPIREDVTVRVQGVPHDMTKAEAEKIARVIMALADDEPVADNQ